jgi:hypothetical protein
MMLDPIIRSAKSALQNSDTAQALGELIPFLEKDTRFVQTVRTLRIMEANFNNTKQQEQRGILAFAEAQREYNRINATILEVIQALEVGKIPAIDLSQKSASSGLPRWLLLTTGALLAAVLLYGAWAVFQKTPAEQCPEFEGEGLKVMILPFQNLGDPQKKAKPHTAIRERITELSEKNKFPLAIEVHVDYDADELEPDEKKILRIGKKCGAEVVIWGLYEQKSDSLILSTRYLFTDASGRKGGSGFESFGSVSGIQSAKILKGLNDAIFMLCGVMAIHEKNWPLAKKWLEKVKDKDTQVMDMISKIEDKMKTN